MSEPFGSSIWLRPSFLSIMSAPPLAQGIEERLNFKSHHSHNPHREGFDGHADKIQHMFDTCSQVAFSQGRVNAFGALVDLGYSEDNMDLHFHDTPQ